MLYGKIVSYNIYIVSCILLQSVFMCVNYSSSLDLMSQLRHAILRSLVDVDSDI